MFSMAYEILIIEGGFATINIYRSQLASERLFRSRYLSITFTDAQRDGFFYIYSLFFIRLSPLIEFSFVISITGLRGVAFAETRRWRIFITSKLFYIDEGDREPWE